MEAEEAERLLDLDAIDKNSTDDLNDYLISLPTCEHCVHAFRIEDHRNSDTRDYCVRPLLQSDFAAHFPKETYSDDPLSFSEEYGQHHQRSNYAAFRNVVLDAYLSSHDLVNVSDTTKGLEGFVESFKQGFHGPICPAFQLNDQHIDLVCEHFQIAKAKARINFGVQNFKRQQKENQDRK